jgi:hypothetical protein
MRSSLAVRASDCQCTSCNGPWFDSIICRHSGIWEAADEAVLNIVRKMFYKIPPKNLKKNSSTACWLWCQETVLQQTLLPGRVCSAASCATLGRVCSTPDCAAWTCLFCSILCYFWTCLFCATPGCVCSTADCAAGHNCSTAAFSMLITNFECKILLYPCWNFCEILFAKLEKAFCFNPNTDPGLFGRKEICLNKQNKPVLKNIGRIPIPSTVLRSKSILPLSLSHEILEEEQLYSWGGTAVFLRRSSCILEE